jgi:CRISPR-associated protein Cas1
VQLVINTYGAYLRKSGNCFLVKRDDKSFEVAVNEVNSVLISTAAYITTDAIDAAIRNALA